MHLLPHSNGFERGAHTNGAFKGRGRHYASLLACPIDHAVLVQREGALHCANDPAHVYPLVDGIARLFPPEHAPDLDARSAACEDGYAAAGWHVPDEGAFKSLPQTPLPGAPEDYWEQQAAATALLWRYVEMMRLRSGGLSVGPAGEAAVIGAGMGWLAYGLDVAGYATVALDVCAGEQFGLGVYPIARYFRVQADPARPPLAPAAFDLLIYQDGLDLADPAGLDYAVRALRPGGALAVMDALGEHDHAVLRAALNAAGLDLAEPPQRAGGWRARLSDLGERLAGRESGPPPVLFAHKRH